MNWRTAKSLLVLLDQINKRCPGRSKKSDGTIGDQAHANRASDHNPNAQGVVTALDITHDPAHGLSIQTLADQLVASKDPRVKYIICNKRIWEPGIGWKNYTGSNPHTVHMHISVKASNADIASAWRLNMARDSLSKEDVIELHRAYTGSDPGKDYDFRHVGQPLEVAIRDFKKVAVPHVQPGQEEAVKLLDGLKDYFSGK